MSLALVSIALGSLAIAAGAMVGRTKERFGAMIELMGDNKQN